MKLPSKWSEEVQKKLAEQGINLSTATIRNIKSRGYANPEIHLKTFEAIKQVASEAEAARLKVQDIKKELANAS